MIPTHFEYLFLLLLYALVLVTLLAEPVLQLLRQRSFWLSWALFTVTWAAIEICGLHQRWWMFSPDKICGVFVATVPLEEYVVFFLIHLSTVALWTAMRDRHGLA